MVAESVPVATMEVGPALEELGVFVGVSAAVTETELDSWLDTSVDDPMTKLVGV